MLYDSGNDAETLENHSKRPEVKEALANGTGEDVRFSITLTEMSQTEFPSVFLFRYLSPHFLCIVKQRSLLHDGESQPCAAPLFGMTFIHSDRSWEKKAILSRLYGESATE